MKRIEEHLYEHEHTGKDGVTTKRFYAKLTTWDRQALTKPLGDDLGAARVKLDRLHKLNDAKVRVELDEERELREELERQQAAKQAKRAGTTLSEWAETYFAKLVPPNKRESTVHGEHLRMKTLSEYFGNPRLADINLESILQYRKARSCEEVTQATINRAVGFLRYLLNLACDHNIIGKVPRIKLVSESDR